MTTLEPHQLETLIVSAERFPGGPYRVTLRDHDVLVTDTVNGPPLVEHPYVRSGRPTSLLDIMACKAFNRLIDPLARVVPADRNFDCVLPTASLDRTITHNENRFETVTVRQLHSEWTKQNKWRGRPSSFTHFNLEQLVRWRDEVFLGYLTIRELARQAGVSEPAAARFAHGETLWYI